MPLTAHERTAALRVVNQHRSGTPLLTRFNALIYDTNPHGL
jgi:hypothetical protein